jgi:hypothetical protein
MVPLAPRRHGKYECPNGDGDIRDIEYPGAYRAHADIDEVHDVATIRDAVQEVSNPTTDEQCKRQYDGWTPRLREEGVCQDPKQHASDANQEKPLTPSFREGSAQTQECATVMDEL